LITLTQPFSVRVLIEEEVDAPPSSVIGIGFSAIDKRVMIWCWRLARLASLASSISSGFFARMAALRILAEVLSPRMEAGMIERMTCSSGVP
jgi:hypothetical protein